MLALLVFVAPSYAALAAPNLTGPGSGASVNAAPVFQWNAVSGADHYSFQIAATNTFSPMVYSVDTKNTRATLLTVLQNKTYYWRVQAVTAAGAKSPWSAVRSFVMAWATAPSDQVAPQSPASGSTVTYPAPTVLNWTVVPGADKYQLTVATDPNLVHGLGGMPVTTEATAYALPNRLGDQTYYWGVTPVDAEGHKGPASNVWSFHYQWPSVSSDGSGGTVAPTLTVTDLNPDPNVFDPQFSWTPIEGAAYYRVDVSSTSDFGGGSIVWTSDQTVATSMTPTKLLPSTNGDYWRVTPYDADNQGGDPVVWSDQNDVARSFAIDFDTGPGAIPNLSMRDSSFAAVPWVAGDPNNTDTPIVGWSDVAGAAYYEVQVSPFAGGKCDWATVDWDDQTITTAWTPLGDGHSSSANPLAQTTTLPVSSDLAALTPGGAYCARVKAHRADAADRSSVNGSWSVVGLGGSPSFTFTDYPSGTDTSASGYLPAADYLPIETGTSQMPVFNWNPIQGYSSYYVVVATDQTFTHIVDYAFTKVTAYAPRTGLLGPRAYADGSYYWAVLPAMGDDGTGVSADPGDEVNEALETFTKQVPATTLSQADLTGLGPVLQWSPVQGAIDYHVQISDTPNFSQLSPPDGLDVRVYETSYTAGSTFPPDTPIYWRVEAEGVGNSNNTLGLGVSFPKGTFTTTVAAPSFDTPHQYTNALSGDQIPIWQWNPVDGAAAYKVVLNCPSGSMCTGGTVDTTAAVLTASTGTVPFTWTVQAEYPTVEFGAATPSQSVDGPPTDPVNFTPTISAPAGPAATAVATGAHAVWMQWTPKSDIKRYEVEISASSATGGDGRFTTPLEKIDTEAPNAAPTLDEPSSATGYANGGTLFWHVAAEDDSGNIGAFTPVASFALAPKILLTGGTNYLAHATTTSVTITAKDYTGHALSGVTIKASGDGVTVVSKKTTATGKVVFKLKPKKTNGTVTFTATKSGLQTGTMTLPVF